jgi:cellulose synthase/poly-beta-1,6-N-acetylglucosamine synthase-like glycosyltransferase
MIWQLIFWISLVLIIHSYLIYPAILYFLALNKKNNQEIFRRNDNLPFVSIILSVYNEELVIREKLRSVFKTTYPEDKFEILIGSDGSTDKTNTILRLFSVEDPAIRFFGYPERKGKGSVLNRLRKEAKGEILIFTDAQVMFTPDLIFNLVRNFKNHSIGLVGANIVNKRTDASGISIQEWTFMSREISLKHKEGLIWGTMMGAYGACYAIRNELFTIIPKGFSVDDFFITMKVLEHKYKCILDIEAVCYENVPNRIIEEFRRRIRISAGNYQNLRAFYKLLWPPYTALSFSLLSHKVLRWACPFLLVLLIISNIFLFKVHLIYRIALITQGILMIIPFIDYLLRKLKIHIVFLRFITHFYSMNLALLAGFFKFIKGSETNVWQPTQRSDK